MALKVLGDLLGPPLDGLEHALYGDEAIGAGAAPPTRAAALITGGQRLLVEADLAARAAIRVEADHHAAAHQMPAAIRAPWAPANRRRRSRRRRRRARCLTQLRSSHRDSAPSAPPRGAKPVML